MSTLNQALQRLILNQRHQSHLERHGGIAPTLPAPIIPAVLVHGGLNKNDLHDLSVPVAVQVILTTDMYQGDTLALYWNDIVVGVDTLNRDHLDVGQYVFYVAPRDIPEVPAHVHYHHIGLVGSDEKSSIEHAPFTVKRTVPGNPDPNPNTPYINENLAPLTGIPASIPANHGPLTIAVPRYEYITADDVITVYWSGVPVSKTVTAAEAGNTSTPLNLVISADIIRDNPGLNLAITYDIRDTVKNWSLYSLENRLDVEAPGSLHVPTVRDANDSDELDVSDGTDVAIQIPVNGNLDVPSSGTLTWTGQPVLGPRLTYTQAFQITQAATRLTLLVPHAQAAALAGSTATVYYDGVHSGVPGRSNRATVTVIGEPVTLAKPSLTGVSGDTYNPDLIEGDYQEVIVPAYAFMAVGQGVTVIWEGTTASGASVYQTVTVPVERESQMGRPISVQIEKRFASALVGGALRVTYQVIADGQRYDSEALELTVTGQVNTLPAPETVPFFPNGQVDPGQVGATLQVVIKANGVLQPGDSITVHWVGEPAASTHPTSPFPTTGDLSVNIAKDPYVTGNSNRQVTVSYEARRGGVLLGNSRVLTLTIGEAGQQPWPVPRVVDATGTDANPFNPINPATGLENSATVVISDARLTLNDVAAVLWFLPDGSTPVIPYISVVAGGGVRVPVPREVLALSMDKQIRVTYVIFRGADVVGTSPELQLRVSALAQNRLPTPVIVEANAQLELDLNTVTGDATALVAPWPFMVEGQTFWLRLHGLRDDGEAWGARLEGPFTVQPGEVQTGVRRSLKRPDLLRLENSSRLVLEMKAGLSGALVESESVIFPEGVYVMTQVSLVLPAPEVEGVVDSYLDPESIPEDGVRITATFPGQVAGYWVGARWVGADNATSFNFPARKVVDSNALTFNVPKSTVLLSSNLPVSVVYEIARTDEGLIQASMPLPLVVSNGLPIGPEPGKNTEDFENFPIKNYWGIELDPIYIQSHEDSLEIRTAPAEFEPIITGKAICSVGHPSIYYDMVIRITKPISELTFGIKTATPETLIDITQYYDSGMPASILRDQGVITLPLIDPAGRRTTAIRFYRTWASPIYLDNFSWKF